MTEAITAAGSTPSGGSGSWRSAAARSSSSVESFAASHTIGPTPSSTVTTPGSQHQELVVDEQRVEVALPGGRCREGRRRVHRGAVEVRVERRSLKQSQSRSGVATSVSSGPVVDRRREDARRRAAGRLSASEYTTRRTPPVDMSDLGERAQRVLELGQEARLRHELGEDLGHGSSSSTYGWSIAGSAVEQHERGEPQLPDPTAGVSPSAEADSVRLCPGRSPRESGLA